MISNKSLPYTSPEKVLQEVDEILDGAEDKAITLLKPFVKITLEKNQVFSCFEFTDSGSYSLIYYKFVLKTAVANGKKILIENSVWDTSFLHELEVYFSQFSSNHREWTEKEEEYFSKEYYQKIFDWFSKCWQRAGGKSSKIPTYFSFEKEFQCRDFFSGEINSYLDTARKLGHEVDDDDALQETF